MTWKDTKHLIESDLSRLSDNFSGVLRYLMTNASFKMTFWFRIGSYLKQKNGLWRILYLMVFMIHKHNQYLTGIQLPIGTKIGGGLVFAHFSCIVINDGAVIGKNCTIFQSVTIGSARGKGVPKIGDNVIFFAGSKAIGGVTIGNNVAVGANAVVVGDIPANSVAVGVPAKYLMNSGENVVSRYIDI